MAYDPDHSDYEIVLPVNGQPRAGSQTEVTKWERVSQFITDLATIIPGLSRKSETQCIIEQDGADYPTPPTGYASRKFVGTKDPNTQDGITLDSLDEWSQPSA